MAKTEGNNENPVWVVGSEFVRPQPLDLIISGGTVTDMNGNKVFQVKTPVFGLHNKRILVDPNETPLLTMKMKVTSKHDRWQVFRGNHTDELIFSVKRASTVQLKTKVDVFLKQNQTEEETCDFTVKGRFMKRTCLVYAGDSDRIISQVHEADHKLLVTVYPNVDYAFIVTLVLVFDLVNMSASTNN